MGGQCNRREFLQTSAVAAAAVGTAGVVGPTTSKGAEAGLPAKDGAVLRLSSQEGPMGGKDVPLNEKLDRLEEWGFEGLEVWGGGLSDRVKELRQALKGRPIRISAICAGFKGCLISDKKEERELAMKTMKEILVAAGELESTGLIIVPAFNSQKSLPHKESRELLTGFARWDRERKREGALLQELGEFAAKCGTRILLEPLNRDECYFMRTLADAASICRDVDNPGIAIMGDFWHMTWEETSDMGAFITGAKYLHHVHIASRRRRKTPGEDGQADNYVEGFKALKYIGYRDFVSLECGTIGDWRKVVPAAATMLREQWAQA